MSVRKKLVAITGLAGAMMLLSWGALARPANNFELVSTFAFSSTRDGGTTRPNPLFASEIYLMDEDGTNVRRLTENIDVIDIFGTLSPDGNKIVWDSNRLRVVGERFNISDLFLMNTDGTEQTWLIRGGSPTWSPDNKYLAYHASASGIGIPINGNPGAATSDSDIFVINVDDVLAGLEGRRNITNNPEAIDDDPDWSPDGQKIVFTSHSILDEPNISNTAEIYVINADGTGVPVRLTDNAEAERAPSWSPDGTRIVYMCRKLASDGLMRFAVCIMNADGTGQMRLTDTGFTPTFSPDGQKILFHKLDDQLWVMNADGTEQVQRTFLPGFNALGNWGVRRAHTAP